jgi:hypothetical protein
VRNGLRYVGILVQSQHKSILEKVIDLSLASDFKDFEAAMQCYSAVHARADCLITKSKRDISAGRVQLEAVIGRS